MTRVWVAVRAWADIRQAIRSRLSWSGVSLDKQARIRADIRRRRGLGEPDRHGRVTYIRPVGEPCEACQAAEGGAS